MQKVAIFILVSLAVQVQAKRVKVVNERFNDALAEAEAQGKVEAEAEVLGKVKKAAALEKAVLLAEEEETLAREDAEEERMAVAEPGQSYWYTSQDQFEKVAPTLMNNQYTQQFEVKEDYRFMRTKKYVAKLDQYENEHHVEVRKDINMKVMKVENYFFTMHNHQSAEFTNEQGGAAGEYLMFKPKLLNRRYTWRVAHMNDPDTILFTIQKRLWNGQCKYLGWFSCKPILKIYVKNKGDKSTLIYYGVGDSDLDEPDFKFYHSEADYDQDKKMGKRNWAAKVDHKKTKDNGEDKYKVKVKPNEDAALLLLATVCLDKVGDDSRTTEDLEEIRDGERD